MKTFKIFLLILLITSFGGEASSTDLRNVRALHFVAKGIDPDEAKSLIRKAHDHRYNTVIIEFFGGIKFEGGPESVFELGWEEKEYLEVLEYTRGLGMMFVPEVKLLTHQERFLSASRPELMWNKWTYDPRNEAVYELVFPFLDELVQAGQVDAIHIGHDEVAGWIGEHRSDKNFPEDEEMLPAVLYGQHVKKVHGYLKSKGVQTWIWGDMLISNDEFPHSLDRNMHGGASGYGEALRKLLPKDIVICDWHYGNLPLAQRLLGKKVDSFPSVAAFIDDGFRVLGATWKNEKAIETFTKEASDAGASGMIATTWWYVQKGRDRVVSEIVDKNSEQFLYYFPNKEVEPAGQADE